MNLLVKIRFCKSRFLLECDSHIIESPVGERVYIVVSSGVSSTFKDVIYCIPLDEPSCCPVCIPVTHVEYLNADEVGGIFKAVKAAIVPKPKFRTGDNVVWNTQVDKPVITPERLVELTSKHGEGPFSVRSMWLLGTTCYMYTLQKAPDAITGIDTKVDVPELLLKSV